MSDLQMPFETWIFCGKCEAILDYIPFDGERITVDGHMMIQEAGWKYNGIHWECADCLAEMDGEHEVHGRGWMGLLPGEEP